MRLQTNQIMTLWVCPNCHNEAMIKLEQLALLATIPVCGTCGNKIQIQHECLLIQNVTDANSLLGNSNDNRANQKIG